MYNVKPIDQYSLPQLNIKPINNIKLIIGWDHAHLRDVDSYTNLAGVLAEIWSVWKLCGSY